MHGTAHAWQWHARHGADSSPLACRLWHAGCCELHGWQVAGSRQPHLHCAPPPPPLLGRRSLQIWTVSKHDEHFKLAPMAHTSSLFMAHGNTAWDNRAVMPFWDESALDNHSSGSIRGAVKCTPDAYEDEIDEVFMVRMDLDRTKWGRFNKLYSDIYLVVSRLLLYLPIRARCAAT